MSGAAPTPYVGRRLARVEDARLLTGNGRFTDDVELPGQLHAAFVRSPHPHARIRSIDATRALALDGVEAVITAADLEAVAAPYVSALARDEVRTLTRTLLPAARVRHVGEAVALVVARTRYLAEDGVDLVAVEWEPLPAIVDQERALEPDAPQLDPDAPGNVIADIAHGDDAAAARLIAGADAVGRKRLRAQRHYGAPLECDGVVAHHDAGSGELTVWCTTQMPHPTQSLIADVLGVPSSCVRVIAQDMGGGYGARARTSVEEAIIPAAAMLLGRPVKWIADRYESLAAGVHAKEMVVDLELAVRDGRLVAGRADVLSDAGAYSLFPFTALVDAVSAPQALPGLYAFEALSYRTRSILTNKSWSGPYRGIGQGVAQVARELLVDELARAIGDDPLELRLRSLLDGEPCTTATGFEYDGGSYRESLLAARDALGYDALRAEQAQRRATRSPDDRWIGVSLLPYVEFSGWSGALGRAHGYPSDYFDSVRVSVEPDGTVIVATGSQSHGQGHETTLAQVAADAVGVRMEDVRVIQGDTGRTAWGMGTWGSRTAVISGGATLRAGAEIRTRLATLASHMLECDPRDVEIAEGVVGVRGAPGRTVALAEVAGFAYFGTEMAGHAGSAAGRPADVEVPLVATASYSPPQVFSNGAMGVVVEVDPGTGVVDVQRVAFVEDCGTMINPLLVDGQIAGSVGQAIGAALFEELSYGEDGSFLCGTLQDYMLPTTLEMPALEIEHRVTPSPVTEGGVKGMGEVGMVVGPAAIACAVADALAPLGVRIERMPLDPQAVLAAIARAGG